MELKNFTYLFLMIASISVPFAQSFQEKKQYNKKIQFIIPAILIVSAFFLAWDIYFTENKIWDFNFEFTLGKKLVGLPIEEWLFFMVVPYCCVFIYEIVKVDLEKYEFPKFFRTFSYLIIVVLGIVGIVFSDRAYTLTAFLAPSVYLAITMFNKPFQKYITKFYFAYFISIIPMLIVYGILAALPLINYNSSHILNLRIINIPIEDFTYYFLMLLMDITLYEYLKSRYAKLKD